MRTVVFLLLAGFGMGLNAQDFMMQGWYWDYPSTPCGGLNTKWAVNLQTKATALGNAGFTYVWLPPPAKGGSECSVGYDPKDLYDLGDFGSTRFGSRAQLNSLLTALQNNGMEAVADVVYNHRDGGDYEDNPGVRNYIMNYPTAAGTCNNGVTPYPVNGKARWRLPIGGSSGNNAGDYYFKLVSASGSTGFYNRAYTIRFETNTVGEQAGSQNEIEPNGGGDCGTGNSHTVTMGVNVQAAIDENFDGTCGVDEFKVTLDASNFNAAGDYLYVYVSQNGGDGTGIDIRPRGLYSIPRAQDIVGELALQTRTNFENMPSGLGPMNYLNFKPNGIDPTCLEGDWDFPYFFFDVDQRQQSTQDVYNEWSRWLIEDVGFTGGLRMDAVKHFDPSMITNLLNFLGDENVEPGMIVGEIFDADVGKLNGWVSSVNSGLTADVDVRVFDFNLRESLKNVCDQHYFNTFYDARNVFHAGMVAAGADSYNVVTFVNNHDFRGHNEPVQADPLLAYVYLLTNNKVGLPCVFYPDFFGDQPPNYPATNIQTELTELMALHQEHIFEASSHFYLNDYGTIYDSDYLGGNANQCLIYQISGGTSGKDVIVAINFDDERLRVDHQINLNSVSFGAQLDDVLGNSEYPYAVVTNSPGGVPNSIFIDLPPRSYSVWVENNSAPLPADLLGFTAKYLEPKVELNWQTAQEQQLSHFRIERSEDGKVFREIGERTALGNSNSTQNYQYADRALPLNKSAYLYYRLALVDEDGTEAFSPIRKIKRAESSRVEVWPNPVRNELQIAAKQDVKQLLVFNSAGQLIHQQEGNGQESQLSTSEWESGIYQLLIVMANGEHQCQRFVKT